MASRPGIASLDDIRDRCYINDAGCWIWRLARNSCGTAVAWFPEWGLSCGVHLIAHYLSKGKKFDRPGYVWVGKCGDSGCINPEHYGAQLFSKRGQGKRTNPVLHRYRITLARRARAKLSEAIASEIRASELSPREGAERYGIAISSWYRVRNGENWRPCRAPSALPMGLPDA